MAGALDPVSILSNNLSQRISGSSSFSLSYIVSSPDRHLLGGEREDCYYDSKFLEVLVKEILSAKRMGNGDSDSPELATKKRKREMEEAVRWLRGAALNPVEPTYVIREREKQVLKMRRDMYLKADDVANLEDLPNFASLRKKKKARHLSDERYKGKRRSERLARAFKIPAEHLARLHKRIGVGDQFQADVPDWSGPSSDEDLSNYRNDTANSNWLGTCLWPQRPVTAPNKQHQNVLTHVSDKLMPNFCRCISTGSFACIRYHVSVARNQLKSELGRAFQALGFDLMGEEEVSKILTHEKQMLFDALERGITPLSGPKGFWSTASRHLKTKEHRHLVSYFFNVYLLRRVANQSRFGPKSAIDSDEDDIDDDDGDGEQVNNDGQRVVL